MPSTSVDEALRARIDDAGFAQHVELLGRVRQAPLRRVRVRPRHAPVGNSPSRIVDGLVLAEATRERGDDRQDRAFARFGQGVVSVVAAGRDGLAERVGREARDFAGRVAHALEELRDDGAGVAARAVEQRVGNGGEQRTEVFFVRSFSTGSAGAQRQAQVRAGVAVRRPGNTLMRFSSVLLTDDAMDARRQRRAKRVAVRGILRSVTARRVSRAATGRSPSEMLEHDAVGRDALYHGTFGEPNLLLVFVHVDEHEAIARIVAVDVNVDVQLGGR